MKKDGDDHRTMKRDCFGYQTMKRDSFGYQIMKRDGDNRRTMKRDGDEHQILKRDSLAVELQKGITSVIELRKGMGSMTKDKICLLQEKLVQLSMNSSPVVPIGNLSVQLKSIWNMTRKFEIKVVGQNLFLIPFGSEEDLIGPYRLKCDEKKTLCMLLGRLSKKTVEVSLEMERTATVKNPSILKTTVNYQNLRDLVPPSLPKILEDTLRGELSKELIEDDMQGESDK
ncbi:hypothetical protein Godav_020718, partial [Gossypium davidsonii]|nr:hypothetical protein [Gossypium davidsonii]